MGLPDKTVALSSDQIADLNKKLSTMRHNVNNHLALVVAASELMRRKPEMAGKLIESIAQQPDKIIAEVREFSEQFEATLGITRESFAPPPIQAG
jgi:hypothetical protein